MKIALIGGSGLIGMRLATLLRARGHNTVSASRASGVNAVTGAGLSAAVSGADVVVDVLNSPSFEDDAVLAFFEATTRNLLAAEASSGVRHHLALSVVGAERLPDSGYMRAKMAQEGLIRSAGLPYTVVRATQFFEFAETIALSGTAGDAVGLPTALMQPLAVDDVASVLADTATGAPVNGTIEVAGPEPIRMNEFVRQFLVATGDVRRVTGDPAARYFGAPIDNRSLMPGATARLGTIRFAAWLASRYRKSTPVARGSSA